MKIITKIFAISIIAIMLSSIPFTFANTGPDLIKVVNVLKVNDNDARPGGSSGGGGKGAGTGYTLIANGLSGIPATVYVQSNAEDPNFAAAIQASIEEWNSHSPKQLFSGVTVDDKLTIETSASQVDYKDELAFGDLGSTSGIIAQTTTWITRAGKQIVDFDIVFNTNFNWGNAGITSETTVYNVNFMDTQNIATHELGHGVGLGDLYQTQLSTQTMYGYSSEGVTWQRTLESGDVSGLQALYGR